jgi:hypothetical protein
MHEFHFDRNGGIPSHNINIKRVEKLQNTGTVYDHFVAVYSHCLTLELSDRTSLKL